MPDASHPRVRVFVQKYTHSLRIGVALPSRHITSGRKRPVNLTLSEDVGVSARQYSHNLSATVDALLKGFVQQQQRALHERQQQARACTNEWNGVTRAVGSFADEHSTL